MDDAVSHIADCFEPFAVVLIGCLIHHRIVSPRESRFAQIINHSRLLLNEKRRGSICNHYPFRN